MNVTKRVFLLCLTVLLVMYLHSSFTFGRGFRFKSIGRARIGRKPRIWSSIGSRGGSRGTIKGASRGRRFGDSKIESSTIDTELALSYFTTSRRKYSNGRSVPTTDSDYVYFASSDLEDSFNVKANDDYTPFILVLDATTAYDCLIVPRTVDATECPSVFKKYVTSETYFNFPHELNVTSRHHIRSKKHIALCCGCHRLYPSIAFVLFLSWLGTKISSL